MQKVLAGITMSMDGYVTGPNDRRGAGLGDGGERLHYWVFGGPWTYDTQSRGTPAPEDQAYLDEVFPPAARGSSAARCTTSSTAGATTPASACPYSSSRTAPTRRQVKGDTTFTFVTDGAEAALAQAREAAGDRNVIVMGGADLLRQYLDLGVVDEITLTIAPILLGGGKRLFEGIGRTDLAFERTAVVESPFATHIRYRVGEP